MRLHIYQDPMFGGVSLVFFEDRGIKRFISKPIKLEMEEYEEGADYKPTIIIPRHYSQEFLKNLAEELDYKGVKTDNDAKIKGTLDATKFHLEDLRKLLKLKN